MDHFTVLSYYLGNTAVRNKTLTRVNVPRRNARFAVAQFVNCGSCSIPEETSADKKFCLVKRRPSVASKVELSATGVWERFVAPALCPVLCYLQVSHRRTASPAEGLGVNSGCATDFFRKRFSRWRAVVEVVCTTNRPEGQPALQAQRRGGAALPAAAAAAAAWAAGFSACAAGA